MAGIPVSGPGKFSQRTDRQPLAQIPNADYGEQKAYKQLQQDAPMASQPSVPAGGSAPSFAEMFGNPADRVIPLSAESQMPGVPVTDGAARGPGGGTDILGLQPQDAQANAKLMAWLPALEFMANQPDSSTYARALVRRIKATQ